MTQQRSDDEIRADVKYLNHHEAQTGRRSSAHVLLTHDVEPLLARAERAEALNREQERWIDEAVLALDSASVIGARSCREGDGLHLSNHDRLIREAREWSSYARYSTHSIEPLPRATLAAGLSLQEEQE